MSPLIESMSRAEISADTIHDRRWHRKNLIHGPLVFRISQLEIRAKFLATGRTFHQHAADICRKSQSLPTLRTYMFILVSHVDFDP